MARIPEAIGKYTVLDQLAQGGMGAVYTATHPTLDRTVIIKKLTLRGDASIRERFRREAQIMMDLRNDAIVDVYDHFREGSSYYIVQEYVDGLSLEALIERDRYLPERIALTILREACRALAYAHEHRVVHRDIKPANILISERGEVKLVDFGIATIHGDTPSELTREGTTLGTPSYMAPEQFHSSRGVDFKADVYSLGVVLYEMVTGKRPYSGSLSPEAIARIQQGRYERPRRVNPRVSRRVSRLIRALMHPKPKRRIGDLDRLIERLDKVLGISSRTAAPGILKPYMAGEASAPRLRARRPLRLTAAASGLFALLLAALWGYQTGYHLELFAPREYGAVVVTVTLQEGDAEATLLRGELYTAALEPLDGRRLRFRRVVEEESWERLVYRSRRLQLPAGEYASRVELNSRAAWHFFEVLPLAERSRSAIPIPGRREDATNLAVRFAPSRPLPLEVTFEARDRHSGERLDGVVGFVRLGGRWRRLTQPVEAALRSGTVIDLRFSAAGYETESLSIDVPREQTLVNLNVRMEPQE